MTILPAAQRQLFRFRLMDLNTNNWIARLNLFCKIPIYKAGRIWTSAWSEYLPATWAARKIFR